MSGVVGCSPSYAQASEELGSCHEIQYDETMTIERSAADELEALAQAETGALGRPMASNRWRIPPDIDLEVERLVWTDRLMPIREARPTEGMLERFVALSGAAPERVVTYARRWGVLGICRHSLPMTHNPPPIPRKPGGVPMTWCYPLGWREGALWEPIAAWRRYAAQMRALLNIGARVQDGKPGRAEDWQVLYPHPEELVAAPAVVRPGTFGPWWGHDAEADRAGVAYQLKEWLSMARVELEPAWDEPNRLVLRLAVGGLFGALIVQLMLAITRTDGLAICSACGVAYIPKRRPAANRRRYCTACRRRGAAVRDSSADYRRRIRALIHHT